MGAKITVFVVEDSPHMRESLRRMLQFEPDLELLGEAGDGEEGVAAALKLRPDVVLMDINLPKKDGISATAELLKTLSCNVVMLSVEGDQEYFRRAMQAGARDYLVKPFSSRDLVAAIRHAYQAGGSAATGAAAGAAPVPERGTVVAVFSTKGGVGKSTLAANLAASLAVASGKPVGLADFDLEFGCQAALLGVKPQSSIVNLCRGDGHIDAAILDKVLAPGPADVFLLPAPPTPDLAAEVEGEGKRQRDRNYAAEALAALADRFPVVVCDLASNFREATLAALDRADIVLMLTGVDLPSLQNTGKGLDILLEHLEYPRSKLRLVVSQCGAMVGLTVDDVSQGLDFPAWATIPGDPRTAAWAANYGKPFVLNRRESPAARAMQQMASRLIEEIDQGRQAAQTGKAEKVGKAGKAGKAPGRSPARAAQGGRA